ncbi:MAG: GT-D fold domain-containing glycosyltransferase [Lachnospiraceae bacterium]|nr:GT-D fold domain-containing glycosyltransferase [Lachnospiraceae bacterium]
MINIYIFGIGQGKKYLDRCLLNSNVNICGFIDNYKAEEMNLFEGISVVKQSELYYSYDYIIITLMQYEDTRDSLLKEGIGREKIISFFDFGDASNELYWGIIDAYKWRTELMWKHYTEIVKPSVENMGYELYANSNLVKRECPKIMDVENTVNILNTERKCLARFGDGEFEIMCGRHRANFQDVDDKLSERLKEVLNSHLDNLLIAIADNYSSLEKYTDDAAMAIRMYLTKDVRKNHMDLLDLDRQYYNAYLSRPYIIYRDKENAKNKFNNLREIWNDENVLIVEGEFTRFGVGNDLLDNARSVERIIAPGKNAFEKYNEIKEGVYKHGKEKLILAILGPTATVLAYDLAKENYWIIDIGQLDVEYEWFLQGVNRRCNLKYKNVSEVISYSRVDSDIEDDNLKLYYSEIVERIL